MLPSQRKDNGTRYGVPLPSPAVATQASIEIDRHDVDLEENIKEVGTHEVVVRPHPEVQIPLLVEVTPA